MRGNDFLDKMELIDPAYVEAADDKPKRKKRQRATWGALAACFAIMVLAGTGILQDFWAQDGAGKRSGSAAADDLRRS